MSAPTGAASFSSNFDFSASLSPPSFIPLTSGTNRRVTRSPPVPAVVSLADPGSAFAVTTSTSRSSTFPAEKDHLHQQPIYAHLSFDIESGDIGSPRTAEAKGSLLSLSRYRSYFDVSTHDVLHRLKIALLPWTNSLAESFWESPGGRETHPDLYGFLWVTLTLGLVLPVSSNCGSMLHQRVVGSTWSIKGRLRHLMAPKELLDQNIGRAAQQAWAPQFDLVTAGLLAACLCAWVPSLLLWGSFKYTKGRRPLTDFLSLIGYALSPYVLACAFCVLPVSIFRWAFLCLAGGFAARFIVNNLKTDIHASAAFLAASLDQNRPKISATMMLAVLVLFEFISVSLKIRFF